MYRTLAAFVLVALVLAAAGCDRDPAGSLEPVGGGSGKADSPTACTDAACDTPCQAQLIWMQKDAYSDVAGRSDPRWPPHTTTVLDVTCPQADGADEVIRAEMDNHGSSTTTVDAAGTPMLVEVKRSDRVYGRRADLLALQRAFQACSCESGTTFLSMDLVRSDPVMQQILAALIVYVNVNLVCAGGVTTADVVAAIQAEDFEVVVAYLPFCSWANADGSWNDGMTQAATTVLGNVGTQLSGYHVCNNDAMLQAQLFSSYAQTGVLSACDATTPVCHGPVWVYNP